jgi:F-type H+-transporting ATPase subunit b
MHEIVHQLGELFLQAVPTVLILIVFYIILKVLFFTPLLKVMAERDARTLGSRKAAETAQAAAAEKVKQYHDALKQARAKVYAEQETERKKLLDERAALQKDTRGKAAAEVTQAKDRVAGELTAARKEIEGTIAQLSTEIARRVLQNAPPANPTPTSPREAQ